MALKNICVVSVALAPIVTFAQQVGPAASDKLDTIVVTAEKHAADLQKTAASLAVVTGEDLLQHGMQELDQVMATVGAVKVLEGQDGPTFYIRGVGTGVPSSIGDPEINLNIDGVYQSEPQYARAGLYDVNRIEVLRGPQGTLYGRNAVAGVVNIITNDPSFVQQGYASVGSGNYNLIQTQGALNVPLSDTVAVRAAFGTESHSGYLSDGADDADVQSARVKLLWRRATSGPTRARIYCRCYHGRRYLIAPSARRSLTEEEETTPATIGRSFDIACVLMPCTARAVTSTPFASCRATHQTDA